MNSWPSPAVPPLPGKGTPLALYDTARDGVHETTPEGPARLYVCGITPYDATHLGHAATMITFDLINRLWRDAGHPVSYVQNVTDIDDPLLERAARSTRCCGAAPATASPPGPAATSAPAGPAGTWSAR